MPMTYSTATKRAERATDTKSRAHAGWELAALGAAALPLLVGFVLLYRAQAPSLAAAEQALAARTAVNLNETASRDALVPLLADVFPITAERLFVAQRIEAFQLGADDALGARRQLDSVGTLARLTVPAAVVRANRQLPTFAARLGPTPKASKAGSPRVTEPPLPLFTPAQLARLKPSLVVRGPATYRRHLVFAVLALVGSFGLAWLWGRLRRAAGDPVILPAVLLMTGLGCLALLSLRDPLRDLPLYIRFVQGVCTGTLLMSSLRHLDLERSPLRRLSYVPLGGAILLSAALILFGTGPGTSDAKVNLLGAQPVEAIRLLALLFFAGYFASRWEPLRELAEPRTSRLAVLRVFDVPRLDYVLPVVAGVGLILVFFFLQKDLGPALAVSCLFLALYGVARRRVTMVVAGFVLLFAGFMTGYALGVPRTVVQRVAMWRSPFDNAIRGGDQVAQALWGLASGGATGTGLGLGDPGFVPAAHTDLILAAVGEELGWIGFAAVFVLAATLFVRSARIALRAGTDYGFFLTLGVAISLAVQLLLIASGLLGLLPLTGVVTPFLSYGRSAMLANFAALGIVLGIADRAGPARLREEFGRPVAWLGAAFGALALVVLARAADVQVLRADTYAVAPTLSVQRDDALRYAYNPRLLAAASQVVRGTVYDRQGIPLATSRPEVFARAHDQFVRLGARTDTVCGDTDARCYPLAGITYHLLGDVERQVNWGASNTSFVERDNDARLRGWDDHARVVEVTDPRTGHTSRVVRRTLSGVLPLLRHRYQPDHPSVKAIVDSARDVRLTIDARFQSQVAAILARRIAQAGRSKGAVVVMSASGEVLASVSYPWPTATPGMAGLDLRASAGTDDPLIDRARYGVYPPGSSFKIVTAAAALRTRPDLVSTTATCERLPDGRVGARIPGWARPVRDDPTDTTPHGAIDLSRALVVSCNAYFAQLGMRLGAAPLADTAHLFDISLGQPESAAQLRDTLPHAAYGQGQVLVTPFKMARVAAMVAAGGAAPQGRWLLDGFDPRADPPRPVLTPQDAAVLGRTMRAVVTDGTGRGLAGLSTPIAGKTGTAEVQGKASHSWFVGFAPFGASGRRIAFAVIVENGGYGATLAAGIAGEVVTAARELGIIGGE
jgi:cell division protein FtsW (lipid II flippase)